VDWKPICTFDVEWFSYDFSVCIVFKINSTQGVSSSTSETEYCGGKSCTRLCLDRIFRNGTASDGTTGSRSLCNSGDTCRLAAASKWILICNSKPEQHVMLEVQ